MLSASARGLALFEAVEGLADAGEPVIVAGVFAVSFGDLRIPSPVGLRGPLLQLYRFFFVFPGLAAEIGRINAKILTRRAPLGRLTPCSQF